MEVEIPYVPPVKFHFRVDFPEIGDSGAGDNDTLFQSVSGLSVDMQTETIKEGGENGFEHVVPTRAKYDVLVLKRGVLRGSEVISWFRDAIENFEFSPITVVVHLLNKEHQSLISWKVIHAWPKKWSIDGFDAKQSEVLVETLELQYAFFTVDEA